jgi:signal transduction histidine kinase
MLRPLRTITRTAQEISASNLHQRLALDGPQDELKELADTLDGLFERLEATYRAQRQFVANASHELRAPLTRQRALIEVTLANPTPDLAALRHAHQRVLASEQQLEQIIDGLLTLTRGQAGPERLEPIDLATLTADALLTREALVTSRELELHTTLVPAPTTGDQRLIERLIANLIDNAIHHNTPGGYIDIATRTHDQHATLTIANSGPTIPPDQIPRLFQPFQRLDGQRTHHTNGHGLGLGLSIVQAIANTHHAELAAQPRDGGGLEVRVSFITSNPKNHPRDRIQAQDSHQRPFRN